MAASSADNKSCNAFVRFGQKLSTGAYYLFVPVKGYTYIVIRKALHL